MDNSFVYMYGLPNAISRSSKFYKKLGAFTTVTCIIIIICIIFSFKSRDNFAHKTFCGVENMYNQPFFIELTSNSTAHRDNTVANFKNNISLMRPLEGYWETALVEISYTKCWKNLRKDMNLCIVNETLIDISQNSINKTNIYDNLEETRKCGVIKSGHYDTIDILVSEIENEILKLNHKNIEILPKFSFDNITKLITITPGKDNNGSFLLPLLNEEVSNILGFDNYSTLNPKYRNNKIVANRPAEIQAGIHSLFVYADLVEPQYIGDTRAKLLRAVEIPSEKKYGDSVVLKYSNPHYIPVLVTDFETIEIDIKDDTNSRVPFMGGRTRIKLHFRPKNG